MSKNISESAISMTRTPNTKKAIYEAQTAICSECTPEQKKKLEAAIRKMQEENAVYVDFEEIPSTKRNEVLSALKNKSLGLRIMKTASKLVAKILGPEPSSADVIPAAVISLGILYTCGVNPDTCVAAASCLGSVYSYKAILKAYNILKEEDED